MDTDTTPTARPTAVHGSVAPGFEGVREEFAACVAAEPADPGAQLAAYVHGRRVVDLWSGDGVTGESLTGVYSSTKGAAFLTVALLVQDGVLALDERVAHHWPEFAAEGKGEVTLRQLLTHSAGVPGADGGFTVEQLADDREIAARMASQRPLWKPGTAYGYHGFVIGALVGEVVHRATGRTLQSLYEERIRAPYGLDLHLGLPEELEPRFAEVRPWPATPEQEAAFAAYRPAPGTPPWYGYALMPEDQVAFVNTRRVRALGQASAGGTGSARGLAGLYVAAMAELEPAVLAEFARPHTRGTDLVRGEEDVFALGFEAKGGPYPFLGPDAFGHSGSAGSESFADPRTGIAFGYTRRRWAFGFLAPERERLARAVAGAAAARRPLLPRGGAAPRPS